MNINRFFYQPIFFMHGENKMEKQKLKEKLRELCSREKNIFDICNELKLNEYEVLALVSELRSDGINI